MTSHGNSVSPGEIKSLARYLAVMRDRIGGRSGAFKIPYHESPILDLIGPDDHEKHLAILRDQLAFDERLKTSGILKTPAAQEIFDMGWFQRIFVEDLGIYTTSDHERYGKDAPGLLHTVFGALSPREGALLRPMAKWLYIEPILPDLSGKSVLEIGSSGGFWSFKFAEKGAARVTGIEIIASHVKAANALARQKGVDDRVIFLNTDAFYERIEPHDIVFFSEVQAHSIVPFHSFLRALGLAREFVIADENFLWGGRVAGKSQFVGDAARGQVLWTSYSMTEHTALDLCYLAGVAPRMVRRYRDNRPAMRRRRLLSRPQWHTVLMVDVRESAGGREKHLGHVSLRSMVDYAMGSRWPSSSG